MYRRSFAVTVVLVATSLAGMPSLAAAPGKATEAAGRFLLSCNGAMATDGSPRADRNDPTRQVMASAVIDLDTGSVNGFGVGAVAVVTVTPGMIGFGNGGGDTFTLAAEPATKRATVPGTIVEGSFDRVSGATTVVVHPASDPERVLIAMNLDCRPGPAPL